MVTSKWVTVSPSLAGVITVVNSTHIQFIGKIVYKWWILVYCIVGKFGGRKFGESSLIHQTKTIQISTYNYSLLAKSIHSPNFFCQMLKMSKLPKFLPAKLSHCMVIWSCPHNMHAHTLLCTL